MKRCMVRSKVNPHLFGYVVKWINDEVFVVSVQGRELHAGVAYWEVY